MRMLQCSDVSGGCTYHERVALASIDLKRVDRQGLMASPVDLNDIESVSIDAEDEVGVLYQRSVLVRGSLGMQECIHKISTL